jgi:hypothetical protein
MNCQQFLDDPVLVSSPYVVQLDASPDNFAHFMEVLEAQSSQKIAHYLMSLAREFGHNGLIASFSSQQGVPTRQENVHNLSQELNKDVRSATIEAGLLSICGSLTDLQRDILVIREALGGDLE